MEALFIWISELLLSEDLINSFETIRVYQLKDLY